MESKQKDKDFSKIPHSIIDSGLLAKLKPSEIKVFLVINRFANYKTGLSYPTVKTISELSGVSKGCIAPATKQLVLLGLIEKARTGKRFSFRNCYRVIKNPKINLCIIPSNTDKCKRYLRGKNGKFKPISLNTDNNIPSNMDNECPSNMELGISPSNTDKKEKYRDNINRDKDIDKSAGSASACPDSQASPAFSLEAYKGRTIQTQSELELLISKFGKPDVARMVEESNLKLAEGVQIR